MSGEIEGKRPIVVVSGLPRSGTSMTMKMLAAGGVPILTDHQRQADEDNPEGYFELERVKQLRHDVSWLREAGGKAVKIISFHLAELPEEHEYRVLFVRRALPEVLASQRQMLLRHGREAHAADDAQLADSYEKHLRQVYGWLARRRNVQTLFLEHRAVIAEPLSAAEAINVFLGGGLNAGAMAEAVVPELYRNRDGNQKNHTWQIP